MNWVKINRNSLSVSHYVRKADNKTNYWLDLSYSKIQYYKKLTGGEFNVIIYGDDDIETDFYVIPFVEIEHLVNGNSFKNIRKRWIGNIIDHKLSISNTGIRLNIAHCYSNTLNISQKGTLASIANINDYAIENARREVSIRVNQSLFRQKVLENFQYKCCLTGITETSLLIASHIIPWNAKIETRLSPHNGLCLSILYDSLFDKGFFTLDDNLKVIIISKPSSLSEQVSLWLGNISGKEIATPINYDISLDALKFHRENIFNKFF